MSASTSHMTNLEPDTDQASSSTGRLDVLALGSASPGHVSVSTGDSAAIIAWRSALKTYRKSLTKKDLEQIMVPAGPEDIIGELDKWERTQTQSKYAKVAVAIRGGFERSRKFIRAVDMIAQGGRGPGCLLWGSIKFILVVS